MNYLVTKSDEHCIDFNEILKYRFSERGWEATRTGNKWSFTADGTGHKFNLIPYHTSINIVVDISGMYNKDLILPISDPIGGCQDLIEFGNYVESTCKGTSVYNLPRNHYDKEYDRYYITPLHKELSKFTREVIEEGKNRIWNKADPYGRMQPRIGWPGSTVPWFKTNPDGTVMTDEHGGLISNGTMEELINGPK